MAEWIYFIHPIRENFAATMTDEERAVWSVHFDRFQRMLADGEVILVGPTLGTINTGIAIIEAADEAAARKIMDEDPTIAGGFARGELRPFRVSLLRGRDVGDARAGIDAQAEPAGDADPAIDAVERQLIAYNIRDVDAFAACYADDVVVLDAAGNETSRGRAALASDYGPWFASNPSLHAEVVHRSRVGAFVVDEERVTGVAEGAIDAIAIYRIDSEGLIDRVQLLP